MKGSRKQTVKAQYIEILNIKVCHALLPKDMTIAEFAKRHKISVAQEFKVGKWLTNFFYPRFLSL